MPDKIKPLVIEAPKRNQDRFGVNNPFYGKKHSLETRKKISDKLKGRKI